MKKVLFLKTLIVFSLLCVIPLGVLAKIGVGVGTGKIEVNQKLKGGLIYTLPSLIVLNTGDEPSDYSVSLKQRDSQGELKPSDAWFTFKPDVFTLEAGESQVVDIKLSLPIKGVIPGNYFTFLSASPVAKAEMGGTSLGIAAASKLYFTIAPSNVIVGVYYRVISLVKMYTPWSYILLVIIFGSLFITFFKRHFSLDIGINVKRK